MFYNGANHALTKLTVRQVVIRWVASPDKPKTFRRNLAGRYRYFMPYFVPSPDTCSVELVYGINGLYCENTFYVRGPSDGFWDTAALADIALVFEGWFNTELSDRLSTDLTLASIKAREMASETGHYYERLPFASYGRVASPALPNNVSIAVSLRTGFVGRSNRGRNFLVGIPESKVVGNSADASWCNDVLNNYDTLLSTLVAHSPSLSLVVYSRRSGGAWRSVASTPEVNNVVFTDTVIDSQRRRLHAHP
jgi:hypothetical protein